MRFTNETYIRVLPLNERIIKDVLKQLSFGTILNRLKLSAMGPGIPFRVMLPVQFYEEGRVQFDEDGAIDYHAPAYKVSNDERRELIKQIKMHYVTSEN